MKITMEKEFYKNLAEATARERFDEFYKTLPQKYLEPSSIASSSHIYDDQSGSTETEMYSFGNDKF